MNLHAVASRLTGQDVRPGGSESGGTVELADGRRVIVKRTDDHDALRAEAAGLAWLAEPGAPDVIDVVGHDDQHLVREYLPPPAVISGTRRSR